MMVSVVGTGFDMKNVFSYIFVARRLIQLNSIECILNLILLYYSFSIFRNVNSALNKIRSLQLPCSLSYFECVSMQTCSY